MKISDFKFKQSGYGHYLVIYTSPANKIFATITSDMKLINLTKNAENPKQKDLVQLKKVCKSHLIK